MPLSIADAIAYRRAAVFAATNPSEEYQTLAEHLDWETESSTLRLGNAGETVSIPGAIISSDALGAYDLRLQGVSTGTADISSALAAAITAAGANGSVFIPAGTWNISGITISADVELRGVPGRTILKKTAGSTSNFVVYATSSSFRASGITFDANRVENSVNGNALRIGQTVLTAELKQCGFINAISDESGFSSGYGHGLFILSDSDDVYKILIDECFATNNYYAGIQTWYAANLSITNGRYYANGRSAIAIGLRNDTDTYTKINISGNKCWDNTGAGVAIGNGLYNGVLTYAPVLCANVIVNDNMCWGNTTYGIYVSGDFITVKNNVCFDNNADAIDSLYANIGGMPRYSSFVDNVCYNTTTKTAGFGMDVGGASWCIVSGNICRNHYSNMNIGACSYTRVSNNLLYAGISAGIGMNPFDGGINLYFPETGICLVVEGNTIEVDKPNMYGARINDGYANFIFRDNTFLISGTGGPSVCMLYNGSSDVQMYGNKAVSSTGSNPRNMAVVSGVLKMPEWAEEIECTSYADVTSITSWSRDIIANGISKVRVTDGGEGFTYATVSFSGGGGSGAAATACLYNGSIIGIKVTSYGSGFSSAPTVTIDGDGSGATAVAVVKHEWPFSPRKSIIANNGLKISSGITSGDGVVEVSAGGRIDLYNYGGAFRIISATKRVYADYADDTAAAAGGILVGSQYRTGSDVKIRVS